MIYNYWYSYSEAIFNIDFKFCNVLAKHDFKIKLLIYFKSNFYRVIAKSDIEVNHLQFLIVYIRLKIKFILILNNILNYSIERNFI